MYLKIKVLGTAAATSMPLGFCNCDVCKKARQNGGKDIRKRSSIIINDEMLIDLGPDSINSCNMYGIDTGKIKYLKFKPFGYLLFIWNSYRYEWLD